MTGSMGDRPGLVSVDSPEFARQLVRTATDLASLVGTNVQLASIITKPATSLFAMFRDEIIIEQFAPTAKDLTEAMTIEELVDGEVDHDILVSSSFDNGALSAIERTDPWRTVIGWRERRTTTEAIFGTSIDRIVKPVPCDLYIERIGYETDGVDSIRVPLTGVEALRQVGLAAKAIALPNEAAVYLLAFNESDRTTGDSPGDIEVATEMIEEAKGQKVTFETVIEPGPVRAGSIIEMAPVHDVLIPGISRHGPIPRRVTGSVHHRVIQQVDKTIVLARSGTTHSARFEPIRRGHRRR